MEWQQGDIITELEAAYIEQLQVLWDRVSDALEAPGAIIPHGVYRRGC